MKEKHKTKLWGCMNGELKLLERLERDTKPDDPWFTIKKGSYFSVDTLSFRTNTVQIPQGAKITILYQPHLDQ